MQTKPYNSSTYWQPFTKTRETSQWVLGLDEQFKHATNQDRLSLPMESGSLEVYLTSNSLWLISEWGEAGKLAIRTCFDPQLVQKLKRVRTTKNGIEYRVQGSLGLFRIKIECPHPDTTLLHYTTTLEPAQPFTVEAFPRDLYLLDKENNPFATEGMVYVTQNGPTSGLAYLSLTQPVECSIFYFQNFTALTDYCQMTQTEPSGTVSVQWPEVGFALPSSSRPLENGKQVVLSDAYINLMPTVPQTEFQAADQFLEAIGRIYRLLPKPVTEYYDWPKASEKTIEALTDSPHCGRRIGKHYYVNAYVDSTQKPPESMVQLAILVPLWEYQEWIGEAIPLVDQLQKGLPMFYDKKFETIMRWLPGGVFTEDERSEEQDPNKVDSWYLLHTLMNLGRLVEKGNLDAKDLLFRSLEFVIKAAHHFNYDWPVFYDIRTLDIVKAETAKGKGGELDVAGLYTHVMVQAYELAHDPRYLKEAITSAERLKGKGFELLYQSNITIMSALTLAKLWKITGNRLYFDQSRLGIANVLVRMWIWECRFGYGQNYSTFMGVAPLKDAPYIAAYEEAEIFATMMNYLKEVGSDVPDTVRLLFSEYFKYLLHRGRFYFPSELPKEMVCPQPREGRLIRELPIPLEDLSTGWKQVGEVGQEVYGGALAYILTTYAYKQFENIPVIIFSDYPIYHAEYEFTAKNEGYMVIRLAGTADYKCRVRLISRHRSITDVMLFDEMNPGNPALDPVETTGKYLDYSVQGNQRLRIEWGMAKKD